MSELIEGDVAQSPPASRGRAGTQGGWPAIVSLALAVFGLATAEFLPASLLTPIASDLHVSIGAAGQAVTTTAAVAAVAGPSLLIGAARFDRRVIVLTVSTMIVLSDLVAASAPNLLVFLAGRVALGVALAGIGSLAASLCMRLAPPAAFSKAMAMIFTGMTAATVFAPPFGVYVGRIWGWRATFLCAAVIGAVALLAQLITLPRMSPREAGDRAMFSRLLRRPGVAAALFSGMLIILGHSAGFTYVRPFLERGPKLNADAISLVFLALGAGGFIGNLLAGVVAGRSARLAASFAAFLIAVATLILVAYGFKVPVVFAATLFWGLGFGMTPISIQTMTVQAAPDLAESVGAVTMSAFQAAIALGAVAGAALTDRIGPGGAIGFCALTAAAGGGMVLARGGAPRG